jgi:hypothetical protein
MDPPHAGAKKPRRGIVARILLMVGGFVLAGGAAALAFFVVGVIDAANNDAIAQATSLVAPTAPTATEAGATAVTVGWTTHTQPTGVVVQYTATARPGTASCTTNTSSCQITGLTPGTAYTFSIVASLDSWTTTPITSSFTTLGVTTSSLPNATFGATYPATLTATGGTGADTWTLTSGTLPAGLTLNTNGTFSGTPTSTTAESGLVFTATDSLGFTAVSSSLSITVLQDSTTTTITDSTNSVVYGNEASVIFTPTVTTGHSEAVPNGSVITVSINSGAATCTVTIGTNTTCTIGSTALLVGGPLQVSASFASTANLMASTGTTATGLSVTPDSTTTTVSETPTSVAYGNETAVAFKPVVTSHFGEVVPGVDSVTVNVGSASCTTTISTGSCTIANTALGVSASAYPVTATFFTGDPDLTTSTGTAVTGLTVTKDTTTTTVSESANTVVYGNEASVSFGATVSAAHGETVPGSDPITINLGSASCNTTVSVGSCTIGETALGVAASNSVTATFATDANLSSSTSTSTNLAVTQDTTTTTVSESPNPITYGNESAVLFSATVSTRFGETVPSGTITVKVNGGTATCAATLPTTSCSLPNTNAGNTALGAGGPYTVSATYGGITNLSGSAGNAGTGLTVSKAVLTVTASTTSTTYGTVPTVTPIYSGFEGSDGPGSLSTAPTCSSSVTATTSVGTVNNANACSGGVAANYTFTYVAANATVTQATPTNTVTNSTPTALGSSITFTATVAGPAGATAPTDGTVTWTVSGTGGVSACSSTTPLSGGTATCVLTAPNVGTYIVSDSWGGNTNYTSATSTNDTVTVAKATPTIAVTNSPTSPTLGQSVVFTATVTGPSGGATPSGVVSWTLTGGATTCASTTALSGSTNVATATCTITASTATTYTAKSSVAADSNYTAAGPSNTDSFTVAKVTPTDLVTNSPTSPTLGQSVIFTGTIAGPTGATTPTGTVTWSVTGTAGITSCTSSTTTLSGGTATCTITVAKAGTYIVADTYAPGSDPNYLTTTSGADSGTDTVTVAKATPTDLVTNSTPTTLGSSVTFTATMAGPTGATTPTGTVTWSVTGTADITSCTSSTTTLSGGTATCTITVANAGTYIVADTYVPGSDPNYLTTTSGADSGTDTITVNAAVTVTSVASASGAPSGNPNSKSITTSTFSMTSGTTYIVTAMESSNSSNTEPTLTVTGSPTVTSIASNDFNGSNSPNCNDSSRCEEAAWYFTANTTSASATVKVNLSGTSVTWTVVDVLALAGNNTTTPIRQSNTASGCDASECTPDGTTATAALTSAPAAGDVALEIIASDDNMGTLTWSDTTGLSNPFLVNTSSGASLGVYETSPAVQSETTSTANITNSNDWATITLEIEVS